MNTYLRKKMIPKKTFSRWWKMLFLKKTLENVRKHKHVEPVTTKGRRNYLVSEPKYHTTKFFSENLLTIEMKRTRFWHLWGIFFWTFSLFFEKMLLKTYKKVNLKKKIEPFHDIITATFFYKLLKYHLKTI